MAVFENVKTKITQGGRAAIQKTKELTETARINSAISETRRQVNNLYKLIGQEIYATYQNDPIPEVAEQIRNITELNKLIAEYKEQIRKINAVVICPQCNSKSKPDVTFCSECGYKLSQVSVIQAADFCTGCGAPVSVDMNFCTVCRKKLR